MTRKRKIVLLVVLGLAGWMYYNYTTNKAFEESPEGLDRTARINSLDIGRPVRSATGILFFEGFRCRTDCAGHQAGHDWAEQYNDIQEDYCWSLDAPDSFKEGCVGYARSLKRAGEESEVEQGEALGGGGGRWE